MSTNSAFSGSATLSGIAVLENARGISGDTKLKNTIMFDAQFWVYNDIRLNGQPIIAALKYYNYDDKMTFGPDDVGVYFIVANIAKIQNEPSIFSAGMEYADYSIVGDIIALFPAGSPDDVDPRHRPILHISGSVLRSDGNACTFDLAPDQYVWPLRTWKGSRVNFPVRVFVRDSPRWGGKKPNPFPGSSVSLTAFLTGVARNSEGAIEHFEVELEKVTYHRGSSSSQGANGSPGATSTPAKRKMKYAFDRDATPCPPTKRRRVDSLEPPSSPITEGEAESTRGSSPAS